MTLGRPAGTLNGMGERLRSAGGVVAMALALLAGFAADAAAGRAQACRRLCRDVVASECAARQGLARPDRRCRRALLRRCRREGVGVCTYPILVGTWSYDVASCTQQCGEKPPEDCAQGGLFAFTFLQHGTRLEERQRLLAGYFTDQSSFDLQGTDVLGNTARLRGTVVGASRITSVTYEYQVTSTELGLCRVSQLGELVR